MTPRAGRPAWSLIVDAVPCDPESGMALDRVLAASVGSGARGPLLRVWQPDRAVLISGLGAGEAERSGISVLERPTPGDTWLAPGPAVILWSVITPVGLLDSGALGGPMEAAAEWPLATLRQLGLQASLDSSGHIRTPMGVVGACARTVLDAVNIAQGVIDYSVSANVLADLGVGVTENVRSQSGLPLPLVIDRFSRMARTLYLARPDAVTEEELAAGRALVGRGDDEAG